MPQQRDLKPTDLLTDLEVAVIEARLRQSMGHVAAALDGFGKSIEDIVRYMSMSARLKQAREAKGWTVQDAAAALGVQQYKIKNLEASQGDPQWGDLLERYCAALELGAWYKRWAKRNPDLAARIATSKPGRAAVKKARKKTPASSS